MVFLKNWISKNWISIDIHWWTSINEFIDGHPSMNLFMDIHQWIHWWISINEYGPLLLGPFLWAFPFGPHAAAAWRHRQRHRCRVIQGIPWNPGYSQFGGYTWWSDAWLLSRRYEKTHAPFCPFRPKNLKTYCCNMFGWFGEVGGRRKNHTHRCATSFFVAHRWKVRKTTKIIFRLFNTCNSSPILLFCPRNPGSIFLLEIQKDAHRNLDRNPRRQKLIWSHMVPFGVNSDASFRAQKLRNRVRVSSFRTAETVIGALRDLKLV